MKQLDTGDAQIFYADAGDGDAVLLLHGSFSGDWFVPAGRRLVEDGYRALGVHRAGYGRSKDLVGGGTCRARRPGAGDAGVRRAHVVGHSSGASLALQLAYARPELIR